MTRPARRREDQAAEAERPVEPVAAPEPPLLTLQRAAGNQAVGRFLARTRTEHGGASRGARVRTRERNRARDEKYELNHPPEEEPEEQDRAGAYEEALARFGATAGVMTFSHTGMKPLFDEEFWTCTLVVKLKKKGSPLQRVPWSTKADKAWSKILKQAKEVDFEYTLNSGVRPSTAAIALYDRQELWAMDCIDFVVAARLYAECVSSGHAAFDRKYSNLGTLIEPVTMRMAQHDTPGLGSAALWRREAQGEAFVVKPGNEPTEHTPTDHASEDELIATLPVGTRVMWTTTHEDADEDMENENTIKVGPDRYVAHPMGVESAAGVRDGLVVDDDEVLTPAERLKQTREHVYLAEIEFYERR